MKTKSTKKPVTKRTAKVASPKAAKPAAAKQETANSQFAGRKLFPKTKINPRREGSHGFKSLAMCSRSPASVTPTSSPLAVGTATFYDVEKKRVEARA